MSFYKVNLNSKEHELPIVEVDEGISIALLDVFSDRKLLADSVKSLFSAICYYMRNSGEHFDDIDVVVTSETKGVLLADRIADLIESFTGKAIDTVYIKKSVRNYMKNPIIGKVSTFTSGSHYLYLDSRDVNKLSNKRVLIVDDVISTGSSLLAIEDILNQVGVKNIICKAFVLAEGEASKREDIVYCDTIPVFKS